MIPPPQRSARASSGSIPGRVCQPGSELWELNWEEQGSGIRVCVCEQTAYCVALLDRGGN